MQRKSSLEQTDTNPFKKWLLIIGIILIAANLRAPLTSIGAVISSIRVDLNMSHAVVGAITTLPLLAFAILSPFAPKIARKISMEKTVFLALVILAVGLVLRSSFGTGALFTGTLFIGVAIAIGNVLLPGMTKMKFPFKIGIMTGVYSVSMNIFGALASGLSVPLSTVGQLGWKGSLAFWSLPAFLAILVWIPQLKQAKNTHHDKTVEPKKTTSIWRSPLAWSITLFMGLQSLIFYTSITWVPEILQGIGYSSSAAGWLLFLMQFTLIPITFIIPLLAERMDNQKLLAAITALLFILGLSGLLIGHRALIPVSMIFIGAGAGMAFSLSMMFFSLRTSSAVEAADMSGMAQSVGYLLAAVGPMLVGALHDMTGSWTAPLLMLIGVGVVIFMAGIQAGQKKVISETVLEN